MTDTITTIHVADTTTTPATTVESTVTNITAPVVDNSPTPTLAPIASPVPAPVVTPAPSQVIQSNLGTQVNTVTSAPVSEFQGIIDHLKVNGTAGQKEVISLLSDYCESMKPGRSQNPNSIALNQNKLFNILNNAVNTTDGSFKDRWALILQYYSNYSNNIGGVLSPMYVNRMSERMMPDAKLASFQILNHLCIVTANSGSRASGIRQTDFKKLFNSVNSQVARSNIVSFYNIQ